MNGVSVIRLYFLRATYLFIAVGLGAMIWPGILNPPTGLEHMRGVVRSLLGAVALLAILGVRYPLQMLPLLLFELAWKSIWVLAFGLPLWGASAFTPATEQTWKDCLISIPLFLAVIPWRYVFAHYVRRSGDPWAIRSRGAETTEADGSAA